ncbi:MAG: FtsQ-type POTRA domain-containing protein [Acidobacteria bacterium]|nr:MAG: FtsQ-type POTRA domain-containing protein [Acidobacteriota bacterium]
MLAEIRIHGNHTTPDAEVLRLAGLTLGQSVTATTIAQAAERLRHSGRFDEVEVRKRYRSLTDVSEVALVLVVREHPVPDDPLDPTPALVKPVKRLWASGMVLPVLQYTDGYGFTYGARVSFVHLFGRDGRLSVPGTWGGTKRVAGEFDKRIRKGPVDLVEAGVALSRRTNPHYDIEEDRGDAWARASGRIAGGLRAGVRATTANVTFGTLDERASSFGAEVSFDTRHDPVFPRNAVYARASWDALDHSISPGANVFLAEARGYIGLVRQTVLSVRWIYDGSDTPLPAYERRLLGGAGNLRGYRAGSFSGDRLMAGTAELRVPLNSPLRIARAGMSVFVDTGRAWDYGSRFEDAPARTGGGVGFFFLASVFQLNVDVAVRSGGGVRAHFSTGLQF